MATQTAREVAEEFRCSERKVTDTATTHGIGANLKGRAGFRFNEADKLALWEAMRPAKAVEVRRRRRSS